MTRRRGVILGVVAVVVAVNVVVVAIDRLTRPPGGAASSSYATAPQGLAAYAELLGRSGHPVRRLRRSPSAPALRDAGTVVLLDPQDLLPTEARALGDHVRAGGRLVAGGAGAWPQLLLGRHGPRRVPGGGPRADVLAPAPETVGVGSVLRAGDAGWERAGGLLPILGRPGRPALALAGALGRGRLVLLADASPLQNRLLATADDARLGLALAGPPGTPVTFVESAHGYGARHGLAALPAAWRLALGGLVLAGLAWMASRARRLGPPERAARELAPPRRAYVDALAASLARTRRPDAASAPVAAAARERLARRARLEPDAPREAWLRAGRELGLTDEEVAALLDPASGEDAVLARGRALARTTRRGT